jgi:hypothetical protein
LINVCFNDIYQPRHIITLLIEITTKSCSKQHTKSIISMWIIIVYVYIHICSKIKTNK